MLVKPSCLLANRFRALGKAIKVCRKSATMMARYAQLCFGLKMLKFRYLLALCCVTLCACQSHVPTATPDQPLQGQQPTPLTEQQAMVSLIERQGAQVIQQGARLQIILPTDDFFRMPTTQLKSYQIDTMKLIARYLQEYAAQFEHPPKIIVYGYADTVYTRQQQTAISRQYAEVIASFLWNQGFSDKQLQVEGLGANQPVASQKTAQGSSHNRRVVIQVN